MVGDDSLQYINCGGSRCVFRLSNEIDNSYLALKVEMYHSEEEQVSETILKQHRKDSMVMERLTASPYVPDIYTACASSQLVEYADNGNLHDLIKEARQTEEDRLSPIDKLRVALQVAEGTAAIHSFEEDGVASLSHNDLDCQQFVLCDGVYKINDFHYAEFIPKNKSSNEMCKLYNEDLFGDHVGLSVDCIEDLLSLLTFLVIQLTLVSTSSTTRLGQLLILTRRWTSPRSIHTRWGMLFGTS
jgi:serine/threonine protein kinase